MGVGAIEGIDGIAASAGGGWPSAILPYSALIRHRVFPRSHSPLSIAGPSDAPRTAVELLSTAILGA